MTITLSDFIKAAQRSIDNGEVAPQHTLFVYRSDGSELPLHHYEDDARPIDGAFGHVQIRAGGFVFATTIEPRKRNTE